MTFPLIPTAVALALCGGVFVATAMIFIMRQSVKAAIWTGFIFFVFSGGFLCLYGYLRIIEMRLAAGQ